MRVAPRLEKYIRRKVHKIRGTKKARKTKRNAATIPLSDDAEAILESMYEAKPQLGDGDQYFSIDEVTRIYRPQGELLYQLYREIKPALSLEIGLAYGFSTVFFLSALREQGQGHHIAIDPFQTSDWHGVGAAKARQLGMSDRFSLIEDYAELVLPKMIQEGREAQFIFIDGDHKFDSALVDFTLADRVLSCEGVMVLDDMWMPAIRRVASFIESNRADYERIPSNVENAAVFRKIAAKDERKWDHYVEF